MPARKRDYQPLQTADEVEASDDSSTLLDPSQTKPIAGLPHPRASIWSSTRLSKSCVAACVLVLALLVSLIGGSGYYLYKTELINGQSPPWYPTPLGGTVSSWQDSYAKAQKMVERMTLVEKVNITTGVGWAQGLCVGNTAPAINVGFPSLCLQDGPLGLRFTDHATSFPAGVTVGSSWNRDLMRRRGAAHARQAKLKGVNVLLGPAMGSMGRNPAGGR